MRRLIRLGFSLVAIGMAGMATLQAGSSYAHFVVSLIVLASGMAMCMAPTTASIIASLPLAKAGVGSAVNDVSREVGGAVGIAVLGSLLADRYHSHMARAIVPFQADIPAAARGPVIDSIQAAFSVAEEAPAKSAALLRAAARESFVSGLHLPLWVACGAALVAMVVISSNIPDTPPLGEAHT
jgi:MFS family permease